MKTYCATSFVLEQLWSMSNISSTGRQSDKRGEQRTVILVLYRVRDTSELRHTVTTGCALSLPDVLDM